MKIVPILLCTAFACAAPTHAQSMDMPGMHMPAPASPKPAKPSAPAMSMPMSNHSSHEGMMEGALGPYAMERESSGTAWNPTETLALQGSWGHFTHPEQLEPGVDQARLSASALYAREIAPDWRFAGMPAWGRKNMEHHTDDAYVAEASLKHQAWTVFGRGEMINGRELITGGESGPAYRVGKMSLGAVRDFRMV